MNSVFTQTDNEIRCMGDICCRTCDRFVRVTDRSRDSRTDLIKTIHTQGFCYGLCRGDLSLRTNGSCEHHSASKYNFETYTMESNISKMIHDYEESKFDKRKRIYKDIIASDPNFSQFLEDYAKVMNIKIDDGFYEWRLKFKNTWAFYDQFDSAVDAFISKYCKNQIDWLKNRKHMKYEDYRNMCNCIQLYISDQMELTIRENPNPGLESEASSP